MDNFNESEHITMLRRTLEDFVEREMPRDAARRWDQGEPLPHDLLSKLGNLGLFGVCVPEEYGGSGRDLIAAIVTIEELNRRSSVVATLYIMGTCYAGLNLLECASEEQRQEFLPKVANGRLLFSYGLTEPDAGSDLASVTTTAIREDDFVVVNGAKRFCTGASKADFIYTLVRSGPREDRHNNLSIVLIDPQAPGVTIELQRPMGQRGTTTCDVTFSDVRIPTFQIVGGLDGWNRGWGMLVGPGLDIEKIEVSSMALGTARAAVDDAWQYAQERRQFGKVISSYQSIRHMLADVKTKLEACRLMTYHSTSLLQAQLPASVPTSMAKLFVCDTARDIVLTCQQVMGAYGYVDEFDMERYVRDVLCYPILGGSSAIQRNNIANNLGLLRDGAK